MLPKRRGPKDWDFGDWQDLLKKGRVFFGILLLTIGLIVSTCTSSLKSTKEEASSSTPKIPQENLTEPPQNLKPAEPLTRSEERGTPREEPPPVPIAESTPPVLTEEPRKSPAGESTVPPVTPRPLIVSSSPGRSCVNSGCHATMGTERYVHGPVAVGECTVCHLPINKQEMYDGKKHKFELAAQGQNLCYTCHERKDTEKVVHGPIALGLCTFCHDPHQSPYRYRLRASPPSQLCFLCHPNDKTIEKEVHGPVAVGDCVACHDPHTSPYQYRLRKAGKDLCYTCHTEKQEEFSAKNFEHPPARDDCNNCHDPHNSPNSYRLHRPVPDLCFGCHPDKKEHIQTVKTDHEALRMDKKCLNCHDPHFTDYPKQLKDVPMNLCLQCHDREQQSEDKKLLNIKQLLEENPDWHGPIRQRDCPACHNPHGTDNFRMLKRPFPAEFYTGFAMDKYALCFGCHEKTLVEEPFTRTLTGFRNGEKNLHFHHVNRISKGRTCRACHDFHATKNPKHIRETTLFGNWALPINYVKYTQGGKCAPGCHVPRGYNRVEPVQNPIDYESFEANERRVK